MRPGAHAEREASVFLGIVAYILENGGVYHAGSHDLQPRRFAARTVGIPQDALHVDLRTGLGEREEGRAKAHAGLFPPHASGKFGEGGLEVHEGDSLVDDQALDLQEDGRMRGVVCVTSVDPARSDDPDRWPVRLHRTDLDRGGVTSQQRRAVQIKRVLLVGSRMVERRVQGDEVVPLRFSLGATRPRETEVAEDAPYLFHDAAHGMDRSGPTPSAGKRQIGFGRARSWLRCKLLLPDLEGLLEHVLQPIGLSAHGRALIGGKRAQAAQHPRDETVLAPEILDPDSVECGSVGRRLKCRDSLLLEAS